MEFIDESIIVAGVIQQLKENMQTAIEAEKQQLGKQLVDWEHRLSLLKTTRLHLFEVHYLPKKPVPLGQLISKYGEPYKKDLTEYKTWSYFWKGGVRAVANDDKTRIIGIGFDLTEADTR